MFCAHAAVAINSTAQANTLIRVRIGPPGFGQLDAKQMGRAGRMVSTDCDESTEMRVTAFCWMLRLRAAAALKRPPATAGGLGFPPEESPVREINSEQQLHGELDLARRASVTSRAARRADHAKARGIQLCCSPRIRKVRMVSQV